MNQMAYEEITTLGDLMEECAWTPCRPDDGYNVVDYFRSDDAARVYLDTQREVTRIAGLALLREMYKGPDCYGVGLEIPQS